jgi:hypothetical protein
MKNADQANVPEPVNNQRSARWSPRHWAWQLPLRVTTGAYIVNMGLSMREADEATATHLHGFASGSYPFLGKIDPKRFTQALSVTEIMIGTTLLTPIVPTVLAGAALTGFAGGLVGLYLRTPGMRKEGSLWPTEQGIPLSKDMWLAAIGAALMLGGRKR